MDTAQLITALEHRGIRLWVDGEKLRLNAPKGTLTPQIKAEIVAHKLALLDWLSSKPADGDSCQTKAQTRTQTGCGLSLQTIGRLIGGSRSAAPVVAPSVMAKRLRVTFRPLPKGADVDSEVLDLRAALESVLQSQGVEIVPWQKATRPFIPMLTRTVPGAGWQLPNIQQSAIDVVRSDINAVFDVERPVSALTQIKSAIAEQLYRISSAPSSSPASVSEITRRVSWAEDHAIQRLEDPTATQVVLLARQDETFVSEETPYIEKIGRGVETLVSRFSEIVIGASRSQISILNMNLSDSVFPREQLSQFVVRSLIPKLYVPIAPLPLSRFDIGSYEPTASPYAQNLVQLSKRLAATDLFPAGFKLSQVVRRRSHRDIVSAILNGRTGVSYGFVAYAEPPVYVGAKEISAAQWQRLSPVEGFSSEEIRQTEAGRYYARTCVNKDVFYRQIPDIWLVCSRSGADKTNLDISQDILRLGVTSEGLRLEKPDLSDTQMQPSYDTYVMVAIALSAALYMPELVEQGAPIIHFHGYAAKGWFTSQEAVAGYNNPAVPCGTYESGVFNFLSIHEIAQSKPLLLKLLGLVEPDHGINLLAKDVDYLLNRLHEGIAQSQIELGGKHFSSLRNSDIDSREASLAIAGGVER